MVARPQVGSAHGYTYRRLGSRCGGQSAVPNARPIIATVWPDEHAPERRLADGVIAALCYAYLAEAERHALTIVSTEENL
jgi:hypothetical protein